MAPKYRITRVNGKRVGKKINVKIYNDPSRMGRKEFNKRVQRVINRVAEHKVQTYTVSQFAPLVLRTGSASVAANIFSMTPYTGGYTISQGSTVADREGNKVSVKSAILTLNITPSPYNATTNPVPTPCMVRIWFLKNKALPTVPVPSSSVIGANATLLDNGATNSGLVGTFADLQLPYNRDSFIVYGYRDYKIGTSVYEGTGAVPTSGNYANNDFKLCALSKINLTKWFPKKLVWDDTVVDPTSYNLSMLIQPIFVTGLTPGAAVTPIQMKFSLRLSFTDD